MKHRELSKLKDAKLKDTVTALCNENAKKMRALDDHVLRGNRGGFRELHVSGDRLPVYRREEDQLELAEFELVLTRTGSHDRLF